MLIVCATLWLTEERVCVVLYVVCNVTVVTVAQIVFLRQWTVGNVRTDCDIDTDELEKAFKPGVNITSSNGKTVRL